MSDDESSHQCVALVNSTVKHHMHLHGLEQSIHKQNNGFKSTLDTIIKPQKTKLVYAQAVRLVKPLKACVRVKRNHNENKRAMDVNVNAE